MAFFPSWAPGDVRKRAGIITLMIMAPLIYFGISEGQETYNPLHWKVVRPKSKIERKLEQDNFRHQFYKLDKNLDGVIDSTEFIYRKK